MENVVGPGAMYNVYRPNLMSQKTSVAYISRHCKVFEAQQLCVETPQFQGHVHF